MILLTFFPFIVQHTLVIYQLQQVSNDPVIAYIKYAFVRYLLTQKTYYYTFLSIQYIYIT